MIYYLSWLALLGRASCDITYEYSGARDRQIVDLNINFHSAQLTLPSFHDLKDVSRVSLGYHFEDHIVPVVTLKASTTAAIAFKQRNGLIARLSLGVEECFKGDDCPVEVFILEVDREVQDLDRQRLFDDWWKYLFGDVEYLPVSRNGVVDRISCSIRLDDQSDYDSTSIIANDHSIPLEDPDSMDLNQSKELFSQGHFLVDGSEPFDLDKIVSTIVEPPIVSPFTPTWSEYGRITNAHQTSNQDLRFQIGDCVMTTKGKNNTPSPLGPFTVYSFNETQRRYILVDPSYDLAFARNSKSLRYCTKDERKLLVQSLKDSKYKPLQPGTLVTVGDSDETFKVFPRRPEGYYPLFSTIKPPPGGRRKAVDLRNRLETIIRIKQPSESHGSLSTNGQPSLGGYGGNDRVTSGPNATTVSLLTPTHLDHAALTAAHQEGDPNLTIRVGSCVMNLINTTGIPSMFGPFRVHSCDAKRRTYVVIDPEYDKSYKFAEKTLQICTKAQRDQYAQTLDCSNYKPLRNGTVVTVGHSGEEFKVVRRRTEGPYILESIERKLITGQPKQLSIKDRLIRPIVIKRLPNPSVDGVGPVPNDLSGQHATHSYTTADTTFSPEEGVLLGKRRQCDPTEANLQHNVADTSDPKPASSQEPTLPMQNGTPEHDLIMQSPNKKQRIAL